MAARVGAAMIMVLAAAALVASLLWSPAPVPDSAIEAGREASAALADARLWTAVRRAIAALPLEQREAIVLRQYHGFSYEEISRILDCSLDKVKVLIFRAKLNLKGQLASFMGEALS